MTVNVADILASRRKWDGKTRGKSFHDFREKVGLSVSDLAKLSGISRETIHAFENGRTEPYAKTEARLLDTVTTYAANKRFESVPASTVWGESAGIPIKALGGHEELPRHFAYGPKYRQAVKIISALAIQRHAGLSDADYAKQSLAAAQDILSLAAGAQADEGHKLADLANGLLSEVREILDTPPPSATNPSRIVLKSRGEE